jgi:ribonuclease HII
MKNSDELSRLKSLYEYELGEFSNSKKIICGLDEAGRGPLAGPVVCSAVILPRLESDSDFQEFQGIDDSKKLSSKKREKLYASLIENPKVHIGIGIVSEQIIDRINILKATHLGMIRALKNLDIMPDCLLVDGMLIPKIKTYQRKIIDGDALSLSIAAASVIAKVTRDTIMIQYHEKYPQYEFDKHKGYGTKVHLEKIKKFGPCKIHRMTFYPMTLMKEIGYE